MFGNERGRLGEVRQLGLDSSERVGFATEAPGEPGGSCVSGLMGEKNPGILDFSGHGISDKQVNHLKKSLVTSWCTRTQQTPTLSLSDFRTGIP